MATGEPRPADKAMDAALRRVLRPAREAAARGCDAELAVAYVEGRLGGREREGFETHMAECAGCRSLCAALADELAPAAPAAEAPAPDPLPWWSLSWRWAVPALAGVAIVGSVVYYQRDRVLERRTAALPVAQTVATPAPAAAPAMATPAPAPAREEALQAEAPRRAVARARQGAAPLPAAEPAPASALTDAELHKKQNARNLVAGAPAAPPPAAAPAPAPQAVGGVAPMAEKTAAERDEAADAASAKVTAGPAGARAQSAALANRFDSLVLPGGARPRSMLRHEGRLWAVCDGGRIFRSTDEGRTWTSVESPTTADLVSVKWDAERNLLLVTDRQGSEYPVKP